MGAHAFNFDMFRVGGALASFLPTLFEDIQRRGISRLSCPPWCRHLHVSRPGLVGAANACTGRPLPPATLAAFLPAGGHTRCTKERQRSVQGVDAKKKQTGRDQASPPHSAASLCSSRNGLSQKKRFWFEPMISPNWAKNKRR